MYYRHYIHPHHRLAYRGIFDLLIAGIFVISSLSMVFAYIDGTERYDNFKLYKVDPTNGDQIKFLHKLAANNRRFDFWKSPKINPNASTEVMVAPADAKSFESGLKLNNISFSIAIDDIAKVLRSENVYKHTRASQTFNFNSFYRVNEIYSFLDELAAKYPSLVTVRTVGRSYENRPIKAITISKPGGRNKKLILIDACIHAREWIAPPTAMYVINQLVTKSAENSNVLDKFDWMIIPILNPDGYEYSHSNVFRRLWRKSRKPNGLCTGTDINRNFDFHWGEVGASTNGCTETFQGNSAFSEQESKVLRDVMRSVKGSCAMYLTLHSYGSLLLYPWGYTSKLPKNWRDIHDVATAGAEAIRKSTGTQYTVGSSTNVLYAAAGGSDDYALAKIGIPIAITMELPSGGELGFNPPASQIKPIVKESWIGIKAMAVKLSERY